MATTGQKWSAGLLAPVILGGAILLRTAGHGGAAFLLEASHSSTVLRSNLDEIARGSYAKSQAVDLFCTASSSLYTTGELPDEASDWDAFVIGRLGVTGAEQYFEGKAEQLETAIGIAQRNPQAATRYAKACLLR